VPDEDRPTCALWPRVAQILDDGATGLDAARAIGPKLAEQAVLIRQNGHVQDLRLPLEDGKPIQILTTRDKDDPDALAVLRHSTAHLLAEAVRRLYPGVKIAIGPPIENGFYYDFEFPEPIGEEALEEIEAEIERELQEGREWAREWLADPFTQDALLVQQCIVRALLALRGMAEARAETLTREPDRGSPSRG